jgi:hypothetical protein
VKVSPWAGIGQSPVGYLAVYGFDDGADADL